MHRVKTKSNFTWTKEMYSGKKFLVILDENRGGMSVTNDIENVVESICFDDKISAADHFIIYKDSDGMWDGWDHQTQSFIPLQCTKKSNAIDKFLARTV